MVVSPDGQFFRFFLDPSVILRYYSFGEEILYRFFAIFCHSLSHAEH